jgi:aminopeptidase N
MKLYFERHDGQAVTCDDFAQAMADANPGSARWRPAAAVQALVQPGRHAGAACQGRYDADARCYTLTLSQSCPPTPGQPARSPL